jgi:H+/Cl- antiporter ClcA
MFEATENQPGSAVPSTLKQAGALRFWLAVLLTGIGAGLCAATLAQLLYVAQHWAWPDAGNNLLSATVRSSSWHHIGILLLAGALTGLGQLLLVRLPSGNGIDITEAIWFAGGRLPKLRTVGSALLSTVIVALGASLGREGAPKQLGAVIANVLSDHGRLSDEQRRLLVACGAGAGMAAAYGVPLGGAVFALEVLRGELALRFVLPALLASFAATAASWIAIPNSPTYVIESSSNSAPIMLWALLIGPIAGLLSVIYVRAIAWAVSNRPKGWKRLVAPTFALGLVGFVSIEFPQVLGNGRDLTQLAFLGKVPFGLLATLLLLRPMATLLCVGSSAPGGLFTPTLTIGSMLGGALGYAWSLFFPGEPLGLYALVGAAALLAAATQGPISTLVLMIELTDHDRSFVMPVLLAVVGATMVARSIEFRSIYDARLSDEQVLARQTARDKAHIAHG